MAPVDDLDPEPASSLCDRLLIDRLADLGRTGGRSVLRRGDRRRRLLVEPVLVAVGESFCCGADVPNLVPSSLSDHDSVGVVSDVLVDANIQKSRPE